MIAVARTLDRPDPARRSEGLLGGSAWIAATVPAITRG
jgi:hypothetical protein